MREFEGRLLRRIPGGMGNGGVAGLDRPVIRPRRYAGFRPYLQWVAVMIGLALYGHFFARDPLGGQVFDLWIFYSAVVVGFWLVFGASGQFAFCQGTFIGLGGYAANLGAGHNDFWIGCAYAAALSAAVALVFGVLVRKTAHFYFAVTTLGLAEIAGIVFTNWRWFTQGEGGIVSGIPSISILGRQLYDPSEVFWVLLGFFAILMLLRIWFERSPAYRDTIAFKANPTVAATLGVPVGRIRIVTFVLSSVSAGLAGAIYVHWNTFSSPDVYSLDLSVAILLMLVLGGVSARWGPLIGAWFYTYAPQLIPGFAGWQNAIYGGLLILLILTLPNGLGGVGAQLLTLAGRLTRRIAGPANDAGPIPPGEPLSPPTSAEAGPDGAAQSPSDVIAAGSAVAAPADLPARGGDDCDRAGAGSALLRVEGVSVRFGGVTAVAGVSLTVRGGQIVGLVGPNGSGKSSFLNALTGIVSATGTMYVRGSSVAMSKPRAVRRSGVVRTFQAPQTFDDLSCIDNVLLSSPERAATGIASAWTMRRRVLRHERRRWERATSVLERVGLTYRAQDPAASLPYGEKRLLELARAIAGDPAVLLLDEPAAGLSAVETEALSRLLDSLRSQGIGMVLVDHKLDFLKALCDEITVLELGSVIASGSFDEVFGSSRVIDAYLGVPEVI